MRKYLLAMCAVIMSVSLYGQTIKLYVGAAERLETAYSKYYLQLIICNNLRDTVFIKRSDIDKLFPKVTNDVSEIGDHGSFYLLTNVREIETDMAELSKIPGRPEESFTGEYEKGQEMYKENTALMQVKQDSEDWYVFAPGKCLNINCIAQVPLLEFLKMHEATSTEVAGAKVYLSFPVWYYTHRDTIKRKKLLISRESDDLKKCVFSAYTFMHKK